MQLARVSFIILTSIMGLTACASGAKIREIPSANEAVAPDEARIIVYRTGLLGAAIQPMVSVNGVDKARCKPQGAFMVDVPPGTHTVSASTEVSRTASVTVGGGQTAYVKCKIGFGLVVGQPSFEAVPEAIGRTEAADLTLLGKF